MKELTGSGTSTTDATPEQCMTLLEAIDGYPTWYPEVVKKPRCSSATPRAARPRRTACSTWSEAR